MSTAIAEPPVDTTMRAGAVPGTPIIELQAVSKRFVKRLDLAARIARSLGADVHEEVVRAVDRVSLSVAEGEVVGLVGESGCGKSTLGRVVAGIHPPSDGRVIYRGRDVASLDGPAARAASLAVQMIFQDPFASLNPRLRVRDIVGEAPRVHGLLAGSGLDDYVAEVLQRVGLDPQYARRYPHQFSGGQRQRIGIARALAVKPEFIVCDEAVAALDVSIQAQVLNLFMRLREELGLTYLFISHDLGVVEHLSDRVVIMYLGRVVESAPTDDLFASPNHPYTQALLAEVPRLETRRRAYEPVKGEIPSPLNPPSGCYFHPRCPHAMDRCRIEDPPLLEIAPGRHSACHLNSTPGAAGGPTRPGAEPAQAALLAADARAIEVPGVVRRHDPTAAPAPLLFDSPHSGSLYPEDFDFQADATLVRRAEDAFLEDLFANVTAAGATLIAAQFPRAYIDPNRSLEDIDETILEAMWPGPVQPSEKSRAGLGLIRRLAPDGEPLYARRLTLSEVQTRIDRYYSPYHAWLESTLLELKDRFGAVWHVDCHSMPRVGRETAPDAGQRRADVVLGDRDGSSCDPDFTRAVADALRDLGYEVRINHPYKGVEILRRYGAPDAGVHSLQIELCRDLYMDEDEVTKTDGFERLKADMTHLAERIAAYATERALRR